MTITIIFDSEQRDLGNIELQLGLMCFQNVTDNKYHAFLNSHK